MGERGPDEWREAVALTVGCFVGGCLGGGQQPALGGRVSHCIRPPCRLGCRDQRFTPCPPCKCRVVDTSRVGEATGRDQQRDRQPLVPPFDAPVLRSDGSNVLPADRRYGGLATGRLGSDAAGAGAVRRVDVEGLAGLGGAWVARTRRLLAFLLGPQQRVKSVEHGVAGPGFRFQLPGCGTR